MSSESAFSLLRRSADVWKEFDWLSVLLPPCCSLCRAPLMYPGTLCGTCWQEVDFVTPPLCSCCGLRFPFDLGHQCLQCQHQPPPWKRFVAAVRYNDRSSALIMQFKHSQRLTLLPLLGKWLLQATGSLPEPDLIIPVPIHRWRMFQRQFNQSALLAERLANLRGTPELYAPLVLRRRGWHGLQRGLNSAERQQNVAGVFYLDSAMDNLAGRHVWLVDDVATTGATLCSASKILIAAGAEVSAVVVARVHGVFSNAS